MVYIEIIYLMLYSIVCFLVVKNIFKARVDEIYDNIENELVNCNTLRNDIKSALDKSKKDVVEQNRQYLLEMNKDISKKIKDLSDLVKNRPII
jgi:3'-phosphoadenosine 5'-phosphosulfate sulfotransferase|tara:strand:- start:241 stop:519 length:279 start_codon:yes stop_codon:yes gene_type:complete